jgi:hypothetical protein
VTPARKPTGGRPTRCLDGRAAVRSAATPTGPSTTSGLKKQTYLCEDALLVTCFRRGTISIGLAGEIGTS